MLSHKQLSKFALIYLFLLLTGALLFYKERMLLADAPWILSEIIKKKSLCIQEHRYGSFITQVVPLIGTKLHLPVKWLMIIYSAAFNLFYFLAAWLLHRKEQYTFSILLALYFSLCVSASYFWTNNEVHQGLTWCMLLGGYYSYHEQQTRVGASYYIGILLLAFLAVFSHPIIIIAAVYIFGIFLIDRGGPLKSRHWITLLLIVAIVVSKYISSTFGWYDEGKLSVFESVSVSKIRDAINSASAKDFLDKCKFSYLPFTLLTATTIVMLVIKRKIGMLLWMLGFLAAYFVAICMIYPTCDYGFYIESEWMCIAIIPALSLLRVSKFDTQTRGVAIIASLSFCWGLTSIYLASKPFRERIYFLERSLTWLQKNDYRKLIILKGNDNSKRPLEKYLIMDWGLPVELVFLSKIYFPNKPVVTAICMTNEYYEKNCANLGNDIFLNPFCAENIRDLDESYFPIDTHQLYRTIDVDAFLEAVNREELNQKK